MSARLKQSLKPLVFHDLGIMEYRRCLTLQTRTRADKIENPDLPDQLFFVQHPSVFTFGKNGGRENLIVTDDFLQANKVAMVQTDRGGNVTYHGPDQAVLYPIVDLEQARIGVADFVHGLEEIMRLVAADFGINAQRDPRNHGLWVGSSKIGSVGLSLKKGISIHGLAMNIAPDLTPFSWINPCGMANVAITSVQKELEPETGDQPDLSMETVKKMFVTHFCDIFNYNIIKEEFDHV